MAGVADLEMQGLLVGLGLEERIRWDSIVRTSVAGAGVSNITQQLTELALGNTHKFNVGSVFVSVGAAFANDAVRMTPLRVPFVSESILDDVYSVATGYITSSLRGEHFNVEAMAANIIGTHIGNAIGQRGAAMLRNTSLYQEIQQQNLHRTICRTL